MEAVWLERGWQGETHWFRQRTRPQLEARHTSPTRELKLQRGYRCRTGVCGLCVNRQTHNMNDHGTKAEARLWSLAARSEKSDRKKYLMGRME